MDFYLILGVERSASSSEIRRAFKRLARRLHPDINPGDQVSASQFQRISEAYETLNDPERRRQYDVTGNTGEAPPAPSFGFEGFDFSASAGTTTSGFGDLFADLLPPRDRGGFDRAPARGSDLHQSITIAFVDAARAGSRWSLSRGRTAAGRAGGQGIFKSRNGIAATASAPGFCVRSAVTWCFPSRA
jgi:molecular chaperone DnaJ